MKRSLVLFLTVISGLFCSAQVWVEDGAVWHYDYWNLGEGGFKKLEYTGDSLFQGQMCQKIVQTRYRFICPGPPPCTFILADVYTSAPFYTYSIGDSIFYWSDIDQDFFLLFDIGAEIGDSWVISDTNVWGGSCDEQSIVTVSDTSSTLIDGQYRRTLTLQSTLLSQFGFEGTIIEGIGQTTGNYLNTHFFLPMWQNCDTNTVAEIDQHKFKCFESDLTPLYNPSGVDCEYLLTHLSVEEHSSSDIRVYPNPFVNEIFITSDDPGAKSVQFFDMVGRMVEEFSMNSGEERIELPDMAVEFICYGCDLWMASTRPVFSR